MARTNWTRNQTIVAFNLYCKIPFNKATSNNPEIINLAKIIGRSTNALKMKIGNFGSFDPELKARGIVGLANASQLDRQIWEEFNQNWEELAYESERLIAQFQNKSIEDVANISLKNLPEGLERERVVRTRVNQHFFRRSILSAYDNSCCITGLKIPQLLIASHIKPWSKCDNKSDRLNPQNGLCLNAIHDKAFDQGLISLTQDFKIKLSTKIFSQYDNEIVDKWFYQYADKSITIPIRFKPQEKYITYHNQNIFIN